jgi:hypothetical protein
MWKYVPKYLENIHNKHSTELHKQPLRQTAHILRKTQT